MNLGPVESKRVSSASSLEGETTPDEKRGINHLVLSNCLEKNYLPVFQNSFYYISKKLSIIFLWTKYLYIVHVFSIKCRLAK